MAMTMIMKWFHTEYWECTDPRHEPIIISRVVRSDVFPPDPDPVCPWCAQLDARTVPADYVTELIAVRDELLALKKKTDRLEDTIEDADGIEATLDLDTDEARNTVDDALESLESAMDTLRGVRNDLDNAATQEPDISVYARRVMEEVNEVVNELDELAARTNRLALQMEVTADAPSVERV